MSECLTHTKVHESEALTLNTQSIACGRMISTALFVMAASAGTEG